MIRKVEVGRDVDPLDRIHLDGDVEGHAAGSGSARRGSLGRPPRGLQAYQPSKARAFSMRSSRPRAVDQREVEAAGAGAVGLLGEVAGRGGADARPLPRADRLGAVGGAGLDLDEDDLVGEVDDEVELALGAAPARGADPAALGAVAAGGGFLGGEAELVGDGGVHGTSVEHLPALRQAAPTH